MAIRLAVVQAVDLSVPRDLGQVDKVAHKCPAARHTRPNQVSQESNTQVDTQELFLVETLPVKVVAVAADGTAEAEPVTTVAVAVARVTSHFSPTEQRQPEVAVRPASSFHRMPLHRQSRERRQSEQFSPQQPVCGQVQEHRHGRGRCQMMESHTPMCLVRTPTHSPWQPRATTARSKPTRTSLVPPLRRRIQFGSSRRSSFQHRRRLIWRLLQIQVTNLTTTSPMTTPPHCMSPAQVLETQ